MRTARFIRALTLVALVAFNTACETSTGPDDEDDFRAILSDYEALDQALASNTWASFRALGGRTPYSASPAAIDAVGALGEAQRPRAFAARLAERLAEGTLGEGGPAGAPIISTTHRGKTFVYDPGSDEYVVDPARTGAPPTGTRFIIYRVDSSGRPILGQETGYADLVDEGDAGSVDVALHLTVVQEGSVVLDYRTALDDDPSRSTLGVHGFLEGDGVRLDFEIDAAGRKTTPPQLDVAFEIGMDARDFSIVGDVHGVEGGAGGEGDVDITVRHGEHSVRVDAQAERGELDAVVYVNGDVFATATGDAQSPTLLGRFGDPITGIELLALLRIMDGVEDVFDLLEDLLDPVDDLVLLGVLL